ncbi:translocation/assembly module TamB domain-containing protein [Adhaeribacter swui]|uniref:Translocation/assembly module TamB domain-containing protein n=1 Tax=Adhaeribacter swui TaxID=2086471 RepID=A0A7G7GEK9_9BACT|nr:translocation/assembly module TamB domain-containing protein [Adhaeribacter swui]QNF35593.1 translocation/assembly module TamB domain-containing protein [Adhaeribacter swui]
MPLVLVILLVIALQIPGVQRFAAQKGASYLAKTLNTKVTIGGFTTDWRNSLVLKEFYLEDQKRDTLVYAGRLGVDINIFGLLKNQINVSSVKLDDATVHISSTMPDSVNNYDFIIAAFAGDTTAAPVDTTASKPFDYKIGTIQLKNIFFTMADQVGGNDIRTRIGFVSANMDEFNPEKSLYHIGEVTLQNSYANITQSKVVPDTTTTDSTTLDLGLRRVNLENIKVNFNNKVAAQRIILDVKKSELGANKIDLKNARIDLKNFDLNNAYFAYFQDKNTSPDSLAINPAETAAKIDSAAEAQAGEPVNWVVTLGDLNVGNLNVDFGNYNTPEQKTGMDFNHLSFKNINLDLNDLYYSTDRITADLNQLTLQEKSGFRINNFAANINVDSTRAALTNLDLQTNESHLRPSFALGYPSLATIGEDINQLRLDADLENSKIGLQDILYFVPTLAENPSFRKITNRFITLDGRLFGRMDNLNAESLRLRGLTGTSINLTGNLKQMLDFVDKGALDLHVNEFTTTRTDILALVPAGTIPNTISLPTRISLAGGVRGTMKNLMLNNFRANATGGTALALSGSILNATDPDRLRMNLHIQNFATTRSALMALLPKGTIPTSIQIPQNLKLAGSFNGSLENFITNANITTSFGNGRVEAQLQPGERFNATARLIRFNVGRLLKQEPTLGTVSATATATGSGFSPDKMQADFTATVQEAFYNKYRYANVNLKGNIDRNVYAVTGNMQDSNLSFNLDGNFNLRNEKVPVYRANLNIANANLKALHFYPTDFQLRGIISADLSGASPDEMKGTLGISDLLMRQNKRNYPIDTLQLQLNNAIGRTDIRLQSNILSGFFRGNNSVSDLPVALQKFIDGYFDIQEAPFASTVNLQDFEFAFKLQRSRVIRAFVPDLKRLRPSTFNGSYSSANQNLRVNANVPGMKYMTYNIDTARVNINSDRNKIALALNVMELADSSMQVRNIAVTTDLQNNTLRTRAQVLNNNSQPRFGLGGLLSTITKGYRFSFASNELIINGEQWTVTPDNYIQYQDNNIFARNVRLSHDNSSLAINSQGTNPVNAPLEVNFANFDLGYISRSIQKNPDTLMIAGVLNGNVVLRDVMKALRFTSDISVANLAYMATPIGNIAVQASNPEPTRYNVNANLTGNGNNASVTGYYLAQDTTNALNLTATIGSINMAMVEGFSGGMLKRVSGNIGGNFTINGSTSKPIIRGAATFTNAAFTVAMFNSAYRLVNETISLNDQGINFNNFTILDSLNNKAVISGTVFTPDYAYYRFDLTATTDDFLAINSSGKDNDLYYGKLILDSRTRIQGDIVTPIINSDVTVVNGSRLTLVLPNEATEQSQEGIVQFVDMRRRRNQLVEAEEDTIQNTAMSGFELTATINLTDETLFTVIVDPVTGDFLDVRGNTRLNFGMDPGGSMDLTGTYTVKEGKYRLSFLNITRELEFAEGGTITWLGDPLEANADLRAIYRVEAPVRELIASQTSGNTSETLRQKVPFMVYVNVKNALLKPDITFDIDIPEEDRASSPAATAAYPAIQQLRQEPSEMNKQVFALLVLNRFLAPDPLQSSGGGGLEGTIRNSLSDVLNDQLDNLTDRYAGGLGLELGLNTYEDYSTGSAQNRTDLNVAVRRQFLNDRLQFRVGTNVGLEGGGSPSSERNGGSGFAGNFSVEYLVLPDGRLRVRGFRQDAFETLTDAQVIETGAAVVFQRDYNSFAELFRRISKAQKRAKQQQAPDVSAQN